MNKYIFNILLVISILFILASCKTPRYAYSPSATNVPVLTKIGDSKIGAVYSTNAAGNQGQDGGSNDKRSRGFDVQGAVAITDYFAIQASNANRWESTENRTDTVTIKYKRNLTEIGLGYYLPLSDKKDIFFQVFAGAGLGRFSFTDVDKVAANYHQANITKIYLQPAMLFKSKGSFTTSVALRLSGISYSKIKTSYSASQLKDYNLDDLSDRTKWFFEPATVSSFGFKNVSGLRIEVQAGLSFLMSGNNFDYHKFNFSIGSWVDMGKLFTKKTE